MNISTQGMPAAELPPRISKKALCIHFQVGSGKTLRRNVFRDDVLAELDIDATYYDKISTRNFSLEETLRIYEYFNITVLRT